MTTGLLGQRWVFHVGNSVVKVDNAFSWSGWGQERLIVNDDMVQHSRGWWKISQTFAEPWLTSLGEGELRIQILPQIMSLLCEARLDGDRLDPTACLAARWKAPRGAWPAEEDWRPAGRGDFIRPLLPRPQT